jgi:DNA-directed RNA polymerase subunit RPC12/RpoP
MPNFDTLINRYRTSDTGELLYECILCDETTSAATSYIICPECGGRLKRVELTDHA